MATIRQVATHAGVSIGTVSKVLNGLDDKVDPATKERVWSSVRSLRYRPPAFEQNQKAGIAQNLGMIVPDLVERPLTGHAYIHLILDGVLERAASRGYSVTIFADRMWDDAGNAVRKKYDGHCDGLIVVAPQPDRDIVPLLIQRGAPVVLVGTTAWMEGVSSVDIDNHAAGRLVAEHLLDLGHRRLAFAADRLDQVSAQERYAGFCAVAGSVPRIVLGDGTSPADFARSLLEDADGRPTGIMAWNDGLAAEIAVELRAVGLEVPGQVSVVGVDDSPHASEASLRLTTVGNPLREIGKRAAEMTIDRVLDPARPREIVKLPPSLVVRDTSGPCRS